jgi:hypothetical protein
MPKEHSVHFTTSPTGWTNNEVGLAWLALVFNRYTKKKARRKWRLLIVDGYGSHLTIDFIRYCDDHTILLCILPPHSTHTVQPLDVVCFAPLGQNYNKALTNRLHKTLGWVPIKKRDFFLLFWDAWVNTFTEKLILSSFEATGILPLKPNRILNRFRPTTPEAQLSRESPPADSWLKTKSLIRLAVKDKGSAASRALEHTFHALSAQNELLQHELSGVEEALKDKKKQATKQQILPLQESPLRRS